MAGPGMQLINYIKTRQKELALNQLENHADVRTADDSGRKALHYAADVGYEDLVEQLFKCGAKPNIEDNNGETPLHLAALHGHVRVIVVLVAHGAEINAEDWRACPPIENALINHHLRASEMLFRLGATLHHYKWDWMQKKKLDKKETKMKQLVTKQIAVMPGFKYGGIEWKLLHIDIATEDSIQVEELQAAVTVKGLKSPFYLYFCRMQSEYFSMDEYLQHNETVYSSVYELRGWLMPKMKIKIKIDVEGKPKDINDFVLVSSHGRDIGTIDRVVSSDTDEISYVSITIKIIPDEAVVFVVALQNNNLQSIPISMEADRVDVLAEEGSEIGIPGGAFSSETSLSLEVMETKDHRNNLSRLLVTNIWSFTVENGKQPREGSQIKLQIRCHEISDTNPFVVLAANKITPKQPSDWSIVDAKYSKSSDGAFLMCDVPKLFTICGVQKSSLQQRKRQVFEAINKCKKKTDDVVFGLMTKHQDHKHNTFSLVIECVAPSEIEKRQKYWMDKEYAEEKVSPEFHIADNQQLKFTFHGKTGSTPSEITASFIYQSHRRTRNFKMLEFSVAETEVMKAGHVTIDMMRIIQHDAIVELVDGVGCCAGKEEKITLPKAVTEFSNIASLIVGLYFPPVIEEAKDDSEESDIEIYEESDESKIPALRYRSLKTLANYLTLNEAKQMAYQFEIDPVTYGRIMKSDFSDHTKIFQVLAIWRGKKPKRDKAGDLLKVLRFLGKPKLANYVEEAVKEEHIIHNEAEFEIKYIMDHL